MTQHEYNGAAVIVIIGLLLFLVLFVLWRMHDKRLDDHDGDLAVIKAALNLGGEPRVLVDPPETPTEPMTRVDVIGGARTSERPVPYVRGRHRAVVTARGEVEG